MRSISRKSGPASRGIALATTLLVASIFIVLIVAFLYMIERDYYLARSQESSQQAFYLAFSALQFGAKNPSLVPAGTTIHRQVPAGSTTEGFDLERLPDGSLRAIGRATYDNGRSVHRVLLLKKGLPPTRYQELR